MAAPRGKARTELKRTQAPWANAEVDQLNDWQRAGYVHEFTCPRRGEHEGNGALVATPEGWVCPGCDYTQDWAWKFMLNVPPNPMLGVAGAR